MSGLKRTLPWVILFGGLAIPFWLPIMARTRVASIRDTGETRVVVDQTLAKLQELQPSALEDARLRESLSQTVGSHYIVSLWLFTPDGYILYRAGSKADPARFNFRATRGARETIKALPADTFTREQKGALIAAEALRGVGGGDHNDVWAQAVVPLKSPDGETVGWLGAIYDRSTTASARPAAKLAVFLFLTLLLLAAYWLSVPAWVYLDAKSRGERATLWALFALIGNLAALIAYLLARMPPGERADN